MAMDVVKRKKAESYAHLLEPEGTLSPSRLVSTYNPLYLDNPALKAIRHKTIITLPSFLVTWIDVGVYYSTAQSF